MRRLKYALAASLFLSPALALADGDPPGDGDAAAGGSVEAGAGVSAGGAGAGASAEVGVEGDAAMALSLDMINESYLAEKGKIVVSGGLNVVHLSIGMFSATQEGLHLGGAFGVTDKITAGLTYTFPIAGDGTDNSKGKGPLDLFGEFELVHDAKLNIAASADFEYDVCGSNDPMTGDCAGTKALHAGLGARFLVAPKIAIFTGAPIGPGAVGQHLTISLESSGPITFDLPVGVGLEATPQIYAYLETNLATFRLANKGMADTVSPIFSDIEKGGIGIPLLVGGYFNASAQLAVGAELAFLDLAHAGDFWGINLNARFKL